jgi:hypothetical protein
LTEHIRERIEDTGFECEQREMSPIFGVALAVFRFGRLDSPRLKWTIVTHEISSESAQCGPCEPNHRTRLTGSEFSIMSWNQIFARDQCLNRRIRFVATIAKSDLPFGILRELRAAAKNDGGCHKDQ